MGQLHFLPITIKLQLHTIKPVTITNLQLQLQTITVKPITVIAIIKLSKLTTSILVLLPTGTGTFIDYNFCRY